MPVEELPPQMAQCSVTGKMVPEDELVTIHGQRVCTEGKAILLERLKAGETMPGELERPTVLRRFGCIFLDGLIFGIPTAIVQAVAGRGSLTVQGIITIAATLVQIVYFGQMHAARGQSVGKIAGKLRVVNLDGSPVSPGTAYVRALAYTGFNLITGAVILVGSVPLAAVANIIVAIWGLSDVICALVDTRYQRSLHDRIAGTRVVVKE